MGLNVTVYKNIRPAKGDNDYCFEAFVISERWKHKIKNLKEDMLYDGDIGDSSVGYSYSTHSRFREYLVKIINRVDLLDLDGRIVYERLSPDVDFFDFIDFADNEGCLDWDISRVIFKSFEKHKKVVNESSDMIMKNIYNKWYSVFQEAKNKGVVVFH